MTTITLKKSFVLAVVALFVSMIALVGCSAQAEEPETGELKQTVVSDVWSDTSTPVVYHFTNTDTNEDFYHAVTYQDVQDNNNVICMFPGEYTVEVIMPVNADGTSFEAVEPNTFTIEAGKFTEGTTNLNVTTDALSVDALDAYLESFKVAAENGDDSFTTELVASVEDTVSAIKADIEAKAAAEAEAKAKAEAEAAAAAAAATKSSGSTTSNSGSKASSGNSGSKSSNSGSGSASKSSSASSHEVTPSAPSSADKEPSGHVHNWVIAYDDETGKKYGECTDCGATKGFCLG